MFCGFVSCDVSGSLRHLVRTSSNVLFLLSIFLGSSHVTHFYDKVMDTDTNDVMRKFAVAQSFLYYLGKF